VLDFNYSEDSCSVHVPNIGIGSVSQPQTSTRRPTERHQPTEVTSESGLIGTRNQSLDIPPQFTIEMAEQSNKSFFDGATDTGDSHPNLPGLRSLPITSKTKRKREEENVIAGPSGHNGSFPSKKQKNIESTITIHVSSVQSTPDFSESNHSEAQMASSSASRPYNRVQRPSRKASTGDLAGKFSRWTAEELRILRDCVKKRVKYKDIARRYLLRRSVKSIERQIAKLRKANPSFPNRRPLEIRSDPIESDSQSQRISQLAERQVPSAKTPRIALLRSSRSSNANAPTQTQLPFNRDKGKGRADGRPRPTDSRWAHVHPQVVIPVSSQSPRSLLVAANDQITPSARDMSKMEDGDEDGCSRSPGQQLRDEIQHASQQEHGITESDEESSQKLNSGVEPSHQRLVNGIEENCQLDNDVGLEESNDLVGHTIHSLPESESEAGDSVEIPSSPPVAAHNFDEEDEVRNHEDNDDSEADTTTPAKLEVERYIDDEAEECKSEDEESEKIESSEADNLESSESVDEDTEASDEDVDEAEDEMPESSPKFPVEQKTNTFATRKPVKAAPDESASTVFSSSASSSASAFVSAKISQSKFHSESDEDRNSESGSDSDSDSASSSSSESSSQQHGDSSENSSGEEQVASPSAQSSSEEQSDANNGSSSEGESSASSDPPSSGRSDQSDGEEDSEDELVGQSIRPVLERTPSGRFRATQLQVMAEREGTKSSQLHRNGILSNTPNASQKSSSSSPVGETNYEMRRKSSGKSTPLNASSSQSIEEFGVDSWEREAKSAKHQGKLRCSKEKLTAAIENPEARYLGALLDHGAEIAKRKRERQFTTPISNVQLDDGLVTPVSMDQSIASRKIKTLHFGSQSTNEKQREEALSRGGRGTSSLGIPGPKVIGRNTGNFAALLFPDNDQEERDGILGSDSQIRLTQGPDQSKACDDRPKRFEKRDQKSLSALVEHLIRNNGPVEISLSPQSKQLLRNMHSSPSLGRSASPARGERVSAPTTHSAARWRAIDTAATANTRRAAKNDQAMRQKSHDGAPSAANKPPVVSADSRSPGRAWRGPSEGYKRNERRKKELFEKTNEMEGQGHLGRKKRRPGF